MFPKYNSSDEATTVHVSPEPGFSGGQHVVDWSCVGIVDQCRKRYKIKVIDWQNAPQLIDLLSTVYIDQDVFELYMRNIGENRNDREDNFTKSFHEASNSLSWPGMDT